MNLSKSRTSPAISRNFWNLILGDVQVNPASKQCIKGLYAAVNALDQPVNAVRSPAKSLASRAPRHPLEESVFIQMGDFWIICYQGEFALVKATRGLDYLAYLLRRPGQEVHVSELRGTAIHVTTLALRGNSRAVGPDAVAAKLRCALPILDSQAKAEYKRRIDELRKEAEEAERFHDSYRASKSRSEINAIAERLAAAVGLGGRDRVASSDAERARSAVTRRIKEAINRIAKVLPLLGSHLAARIKTGYWCSYNPHPSRPVSWKFVLRSC
jgi:hypothetical protein